MNKIKINAQEALKKYKKPNWKFLLEGKRDKCFSSVLKKSLKFKEIKDFFEGDGNFYIYDKIRDLKFQVFSNYTGFSLILKNNGGENSILCRLLYEWHNMFTGNKILNIGYYSTDDNKIARAFALETDSHYKDGEGYKLHELYPKISQGFTKDYQIPFKAGIAVLHSQDIPQSPSENVHDNLGRKLNDDERLRLESKNLVIRLLPSVLSAFEGVPEDIITHQNLLSDCSKDTKDLSVCFKSLEYIINNI